VSSPSDRLAAAVAALRESIDRMPGGPVVAGPYFAQWATVGRHRIQSWVGDVNDALRWAAGAIAEAERQGVGSVRQLEEALWRLDAADDRLVVVLSLALGVPLLKLSKDQRGVVFTPDRRRVLSTLSDLGSSTAANLKSAVERWYPHPARALRHEVTHSLSQLTETQPLIDLDVRYLRNGSESYREAKLLYPDDLHMGSNDIRPEAVWRRVVDQAANGLEVMIGCTDAAAAVIRNHASLQPPAVVYYDLDSGTASLSPAFEGTGRIADA
jgi:hypothetical protein